MRATTKGTTAQEIWNALVAAQTLVGSLGKLIKDNIDASISSRLTFSAYTYYAALATATSYTPAADTLITQALLEEATIDGAGHFLWGDLEANSNKITEAFNIAETANKRGIARVILCDGTNQFIRNVSGDTKNLKLTGWSLS